MKTKLTAIGNGLGLIIEKPILDMLDIDQKTELDVRTDGHRLIVVPAGRRRRRKRLLAATKKAIEVRKKLRKPAK